MLRLSGGEFRGRMIHTPAGRETRPTHARLRSALFNVLQFELQDTKVLDLFAGSGALGFEALSRGAASVVFVENARPALQAIQKNIESLKVEDRVQILSEGLPGFLERVARFQPFGIVFADPPYAAQWEERLLQDLPWGELLAPGGKFCLEWSPKVGRVKGKAARALPDETPFLVKVREKNYGDSWLTVFERRS